MGKRNLDDLPDRKHAENFKAHNRQMLENSYKMKTIKSKKKNPTYQYRGTKIRIKDFQLKAMQTRYSEATS